MGGIVHRVNNPDLETRAEFEEFCDLFMDLLVELTPVDTGACAASWSYKIMGMAYAVFINDAEYAEYLDRGHSKQAPNGMTGPADDQIDEIADQVRQ